MPSVLRIKNPDGTWYEVTALKGDTGITPNLQVGTVTTGNPGTSAEVTITGTPEEPVLNFKIPKGEPGTGGGGGANIDDTTPSSTTTYSSQKIESELTALNDANAALIEVSKTEPNAGNTELWIHPNADEVQLPQINDSVESEQDTWSSKKIAAEFSNKANDADLAAVAKSGSYNDLTNKPTIPTVPSTLPNPNALTFTGAVNETYDGSAAKSVAIPSVPTTLPNPKALTFTGAVNETYDGSTSKSVEIPAVPESLKNPNKLTFTGAVTAEYDGSAAVSVEIPAGSIDNLPVASATQLGGVQPVAKTGEMTQAVGVDEAGGLWTMAGGSTGGATLLCEMTLEEDVLQVDIPIDSYIYNEFYAASKIGIRIELAFPAETDSTALGALYVKYWCVAPSGAEWATTILLDGTKIVPTNSISWQKSTQANIIIHKTTPTQGYSVSTVGVSQNAFAYQRHQDDLVGTNIKYLRINTTEPNMLGAGSVIRIYTWG